MVATRTDNTHKPHPLVEYTSFRDATICKRIRWNWDLLCHPTFLALVPVNKRRVLYLVLERNPSLPTSEQIGSIMKSAMDAGDSALVCALLAHVVPRNYGGAMRLWIHWAVANGHLNVLEMLHKTQPWAEFEADDSEVMWMAAKAGHVEVLLWLVRSTECDVHTQDEAVLCALVARGNIEDVRRVVAEVGGFDIHASNGRIIAQTLSRGDLQMAQFLVKELGADPAVHRHMGFVYAVNAFSLPMLQWLASQTDITSCPYPLLAHAAGLHQHDVLAWMLTETRLDPRDHHFEAFSVAINTKDSAALELMLQHPHVSDPQCGVCPLIQTACLAFARENGQKSIDWLAGIDQRLCVLS